MLSFAEVLANREYVVPCRMGTWGTCHLSGKGEKPQKQGNLMAKSPEKLSAGVFCTASRDVLGAGKDF